MKIETDIQRVKQLAAQKEDENWDFRAFLKGCDLSLEEIDTVVHRHDREISAQIDCRTCANCCREMLPALSERDVERLAAGLQMTAGEIIDRYLEPDSEPGRFRPNASPCPFLSENLCTVYDFRPEDCRSYPHLYKEGFVTRTMQAIDNCSVCPIVFNVFERVKEELWEGGQ